MKGSLIRIKMILGLHLARRLIAYICSTVNLERTSFIVLVLLQGIAIKRTLIILKSCGILTGQIKFGLVSLTVISLLLRITL